jgi:hypothetical protein
MRMEWSVIGDFSASAAVALMAEVDYRPVVVETPIEHRAAQHRMPTTRPLDCGRWPDWRYKDSCRSDVPSWDFIDSAETD